MRDTKNGRSDAKPTPYLDYAEQLFGNGFTPLPADGKAVKLRDWPHFVMPSNEEERARFIEKNECKNIGLRTGRLVAIDNDNDDPKEAARVKELVYTICGYTPFVRIGRAPREVYFFVIDAPLQIMRAGGVEILGDGQQVIVHGIHPDTQEPYRWPQESILDATPDDLPKVDKATLDRLYEALGGRSEVIDFQEKKEEKERENKVLKGNRNNTVFKFLRQNAWRMKTKKEMKSLAEDFNQKHCEPPLGNRELASTIQSAWNIKLSGQARRPNEQFAVLNVSREELETLMSDTKALALLVYLRLNMPPHEFCAPQEYVGEQTGWDKMTVNKKLKTLTEHGFIERIGMRKVPNRIRPAIVYRFL
jgi:hypothetical protein